MCEGLFEGYSAPRSPRRQAREPVASPGGLASSIVTRTRPTRRVTQCFGFHSGHTCGIAELSRFLAEIGGGLANDPRVGTRVLSGEGSRGGTGQQMFTGRSGRSEEHTSELQSRFGLVCRLLLEQKNFLFVRLERLFGSAGARCLHRACWRDAVCAVVVLMSVHSDVALFHYARVRGRLAPRDLGV